MAEMDMLKLDEKEQKKNAAMQTPQGMGRRMQRQQLSKSLKPVESLEPQKVGTMRAQQPSVKPTSALKMGTVDVNRDTSRQAQPSASGPKAIIDMYRSGQFDWGDVSQRDFGAMSRQDRELVALAYADETGMNRTSAVLNAINNPGWLQGVLEDKRKKNIGRELQEGAREFREEAGDIAAEQGGLLRRQAEDVLEEGTQDIRKGYSSRGLLYSGIRQKAEGDLRGQVSGELARSQAQLQSDLEDEARAKEFMAARYGLQGYEEARQRYEDVYNRRLRNALESRKRFAGVGAGLGYLMGSGLGSQGSSVAAMDTGGEMFNTTQGNLPDMGGIA